MKYERTFPRGMVLEILVRPGGPWATVSEGIFRSWGGPRRIDGTPYLGPVYYLGTDKISRPAAT